MKRKLLLLLLTMTPLLAWCDNITFADAKVKEICVANWDTNGDGELSYVEAAAVTALNNVFSHNTEITSFEELQYFTGLTSIGTGEFNADDFYLCSNLQSVKFPSSLKVIYGCSFAGTALRTVTFPENIETIGSWAFADCTKLTTVIVEREGVTSYKYSGGAYGLFRNCPSLTAILVPSASVEAYKAAYGWKDYADKIKGVNDPITFADENVKAICVANWDTNSDGELSYVEAAAVTDLGSVFKNSGTITSFDELQYFTGLTSIGNFAFGYCDDLTSITIPNSVTSIGDYAFSNCSGLTSIEILNSVTTLGEGAFYGCSGLTSITIPNSVTSIGSRAFQACSGLTSISVEEGNTVFDSRDNCNAIIETSSNTLILGCKNTVIPNSVTSIGSRAFQACSGLTSIEIPNSVTSIGYVAFEGCSGLMSISIPNSVTSIGYYDAFSNCSGLTSITVEEGNTVFDSRDNCNAIIETLSNTLISGCKNTVIPNSVTSIGYSAFLGCTGLTGIEIPNSVTSIDDYAFFNCPGLTSITIPNSVTSIGDHAFYYCI